ncbi:DEAD/DEAH box helicase [Nocardia sp. NPDC004711]
MTGWNVKELLEETGAAQAAQDSCTAFLLSRIGTSNEPAYYHGQFELDLLANTLENVAADTGNESNISYLWEHAFLCRRMPGERGSYEQLTHLVRLAADGILANRRPEVMLALRELEIPYREALIDSETPLDSVLEIDILRAFLLLARRDGWKDLNDSRSAILQLREHHQNRQNEYLAGIDDKTIAGVRLIARFNLAKIVEIASTYTVSGQPSDPDIQIDKHERNLHDLFKIRPDEPFSGTSELVVRACRAIVASSIWRNTTSLGQDFREFVSSLASTDRPDPTLELWPSQRAALDQHLLDPARRAIVVEMPTSAGKTLVAEFSIVQAHALNRSSTVVYVVPTRALVNQITQRLRRDFSPLKMVVESAAPVFELDPTEDQLLKQKIDILVCTPEKLDLLIKADHAAVRQISLAVVDEAHNLSEGNRGVRMELLLGTIKRERPETRFLMLTPFVPNASELSRWLGDGADATIAVNWRPSERVVASTWWKKIRNGPRILQLYTMESADNVDVPAGRTVELLEIAAEEPAPGKQHTSALAAVELSKNGSVLVLARGRGTAEQRAASIAALRSPRKLSRFATAVANYAALELGSQHPLVKQLHCGVTYHHAGLSHDLRYLLEALIDKGDVDIVCGTTTLAQGLNFPISSVILETTTKPQGRGQRYQELSYSEFWNIAGRAGRALKDTVGLIVFPTLTNSDRDEVQEFLRKQAVDICSHLMTATGQVSSVVDRFDLKFVRENSALAVFLQYLAHVARVAGVEETSRDIEEILRSSLVYHQTKETDRRLADQLISISRGFMAQIGDYEPGYIALADNTGFSIPSVNYAFAASREHPEFRQEGFWDAGNLFGPDTRALASVIDVIADIPELDLGIRSDEPHAPLNSESVAGITRDWVNGENLTKIAERWFLHEPPPKRVRAAGHYIHSKLVGQIPWGMSALYKLLTPGQSANTSTAYSSAMVFYGVPSPEAVTMRIGGVPRPAANGLGMQWSSETAEGDSFVDLRRWIANRSDGEWDSALPNGSKLSGRQCRMLWQELVGWSE